MSHPKDGSGCDVDALMSELGQRGRFHLLNYLMLALSGFSAALYGINYVFLAADVPYRCVVEGCDTPNNSSYEAPWGALAAGGAGLAGRCSVRAPLDPSCERFAPEPQPCNRWLYANNDTIVTEFNLGCQEWKRTLVGTIHNVGMLVSVPLFGYISDRWGRKRALVLSCSLVGAVGSLKAFATSYYMYIAVEFLETVAGASAFPATFILTIELLGQERRVIATAFLGSVLVLGGISFALLARTFRYWRTFILIVYPPSVLFISYLYFLPESIRWLLSKGRKKEALKIINRAAKMNRVTLSEEMTRQLSESNEKVEEKKNEVAESGESVWGEVRRSRVLARRVACCAWWWVTCTFVFYGLAINSATLAGDKYANYMAVVSVELVALLANALLLDRLGRRRVLLVAFVACGACCSGVAFADGWAATALYLAGKVAITSAFNALYMYTSELFPTRARHSLLGLCSMVGRLGSIVAPQMPLLAMYVEWLPSALFGGSALVAAGLVLSAPETLHAALPDTVRQAEQLGKTTHPPHLPHPPHNQEHETSKV